MIKYSSFYILSWTSLEVESFLFFEAIAEDIKDILNSINENAKNGQNKPNTLKQIENFIQIHLLSKQLRN